MSPDEQNSQVDDAENYVDQKRKQNILSNRQKVEEVAESLFPRAKRYSEPLTMEDAARMWHENVRNYLVSIEPLLKDPTLPNADEAYLYEPLGMVELEPPEKYQKQGAELGQGIKDQGFRLLSEPLEPKEIVVEGLKEVIERDGYSEAWEVHIDPISGIQSKRQRPQWQMVAVEEPMPKMALMNAVRTADNFLQNAGVGLALGGDDPEENPI